MADIEKEREAYEAWSLLTYARAKVYSMRDLEMGLAAWLARAAAHHADSAEMKRLADALDLLPDDEYLVSMDGTDNGMALVKEAAALLRRMAGEK